MANKIKHEAKLFSCQNRLSFIEKALDNDDLDLTNDAQHGLKHIISDINSRLSDVYGGLS